MKKPGRWLAWTLTLGLLGGLIALAITKVNVAEVGNTLGAVDPGWLVVACVLMASSFLARAESWFAVIRAALPEGRIGRSAVTRGLLIGMAASSVAPGRVGEAARTLVVARRAGDARNTLATIAGTVFAQILLNVLALALLALAALSASSLPGARSGALAAVLVLPAIALVALLAAPEALRAVTPSERLRRRLEWLAGVLVDARRGLRALSRPLPAAHAAGAQLSAWALQWACCYTVALAFGLEHHATPAAAAAVLVVVNLTAILPLTPSNVGVFQAACVAVLAGYGVSAGRALAYGLVLQAIEVGTALALGLPALFREGLTPAMLPGIWRRRTSAPSTGVEL